MTGERLMVWVDKLLTSAVIGAVGMAVSQLGKISDSVHELNVKLAIVIQKQVDQDKVNERQDQDIRDLKSPKR